MAIQRKFQVITETTLGFATTKARAVAKKLLEESGLKYIKQTNNSAYAKQQATWWLVLASNDDMATALRVLRNSAEFSEVDGSVIEFVKTSETMLEFISLSGAETASKYLKGVGVDSHVQTVTLLEDTAKMTLDPKDMPAAIKALDVHPLFREMFIASTVSIQPESDEAEVVPAAELGNPNKLRIHRNQFFLIFDNKHHASIALKIIWHWRAVAQLPLLGKMPRGSKKYGVFCQSVPQAKDAVALLQAMFDVHLTEYDE